MSGADQPGLSSPIMLAAVYIGRVRTIQARLFLAWKGSHHAEAIWQNGVRQRDGDIPPLGA
jgi:hypothetical protein